MIFNFDQFQLDEDSFTLHRDGELLKVEPLIFDLIAHLVRHANTVQSKDQLLESVWGGRIVSDTTISSAIKSARKVLGDSGSQQKYIKTQHGRGFSFVLEDQEPMQESPAAGFRNPSLIVLIKDTSKSNKLTEFAESLTLELERIFSRIPLLNINREAQVLVEEEGVNTPQRIHKLLGVDYLLEGTISDKNRCHIGIQLVAAKDSVLVSSHSFTYGHGPEDSLLHDCIIDIVGQFEPQILNAIYKNITADGSLVSAESKFIEASGILALKGWHEASFAEATNLLRECLALEPNFAQASAYLSLLLGFGHRVGLIENRQAVKDEALKMAENALDLDPHDSSVLGFCGCALADIGLTDRGISLLNKALKVNPVNSHALVARGAVQMSKFELDLAQEDLEKGIALSPLDSRLAVWRAVLATAYLARNDLDRAHQVSLEACSDCHKTYIPRVVLAGVEYTRGNIDQCIMSMREAYSIAPNLSEHQVKAYLGKMLAAKVLEVFNQST